MNRFFFKIFLKKSKFKKSNEGFTLVELIISSSISLIVLMAGYYLSNAVFQLNKNDKTQIELFSKIDGALDFVIDEINSGKRIISAKDMISTNCEVPEGEFIFGISLPSQAIDSSAYQNRSGISDSWSEIDCPLIYYLKNPKLTGNNSNTYELWRYGPSINEEGFYQSISFAESLVTDQISNQPLNEIKCSENWTKINVKGISICLDSLSRTAEINITSNKRKFLNKDLYITKTSAGSNRIQDDLLMGMNNISSENENPGEICSNLDTCNIFGTKVVGNITFIIDLSRSMNNKLLLKDQTRIDAIKEELNNLIDNLSNIKFQIISFGENDQKLWDQPKLATKNNKSDAKKWVMERSADQLYTYPLESLKKAIDDPSTQQIILLSDGEPTQMFSGKPSTRYCDGKFQSIDVCINSYNESQSTALGKPLVRIDAISIPSYQRGRPRYCGRDRLCEFQYCEASVNPFTFRPVDNWLGRLSSNNGGKCSVIK